MAYPAFERLSPEKREAILRAGIRTFAKLGYQDAGTDDITRESNISKGLLFYYFGNKTNFYLYCLTVALDRLIAHTPERMEGDFFAILFAVMDEKFRLCRAYPDEMRFVNMAARDASAAIAPQKAALFQHYLRVTTEASERYMRQAVATLRLKHPDDPRGAANLTLYVHALNNQALLAYRETPDAFFENAAQIQSDMRDAINMMLHGIVQEDTP